VFLRGSFPNTCGNHQEEAAEGYRLSISKGVAASTARSRFFFSIENRGSLSQNFSRQDRL
jgi:hypothetical protein